MFKSLKLIPFITAIVAAQGLTLEQKEARDLYYREGAMARITPEMRKIMNDYKTYRRNEQI